MIVSNVKERPIVLTAQEVNAVLADHKTQYRVPVLTSEQVKDGFEWSMGGSGGDNAIFIKGVDIERSELLVKPCTLGAIGDGLWVQEEHRPIGWLLDDGEVIIEYRDGYSTSYNYLTEEELEINPNDDYPLAVIDELLARKIPINKHTERFDFSDSENLPHWRSADAMPRFASRLLLEITDIRIERVQDIKLGDSIKEACTGLMDFATDYWMPKFGEAAWFTDPWVWVIEFKVIKGS